MMARCGWVTLLALGLAMPALGFRFPSTDSFVARLLQRASAILGNSRRVSASVDEPTTAAFVCPEQDGLFTNPADCSSFYECSEGRSWLMRCPANLHFSSEAARCDYPCEAHCDQSLEEECEWQQDHSNRTICDLPADKGPCFGNLKRFFYDARSKSCKKFEYGGCKGNQNNFNSKKECESSCRVVEAISQQNDLPLWSSFPCLGNETYTHPNDCGSYVKCVEGVPEVVQCPSGQHYSMFDYECTLPCIAECDKSLACKCSWPSCATRQAPVDLQENSLFSPYHCESDGLYRNPDACTSYIHCSNRVAHVQQCPYDQHFSLKTERCEDRCDAHCDQRLVEECDWNDSKGTEASNVAEDSFILDYQKTCSANGLYPSPEDCSQFIECSNGFEYVMRCPYGMHFSDGLQRCVDPCDAHCNETIACQCGWPECSGIDVDCEVAAVRGPCKANIPRYHYDEESGRCRKFLYGGCGGNTNNFVSENECKEKCQKKLVGAYQCPISNGKFANFYDCVSYYHCKKGVPILRKCFRGMAFDHKKAECVVELEAVCLYKCRDRDAVYPYHPNCRKYIDCVNGVSKVERCPLGQAFDWRINDCVDKTHVHCPSV